MAQALVRFLSVQFSERDGRRQPFFAGVFGIFGHGNVAGIGQALDQMTRPAALLPVPQRAGDGAHRGGVREDVEPPADAGVHDVDRPRRDQHDHRRRRRDHQPAAGAAAARRHLRQSRAGAGAAAARVGDSAGHLGQRLLPAGVALLGSHLPARTAADGAARSDARADLAGRDRRRDAGAAAGHADRSVRLSRRVLRRARLDHPAAARRCRALSRAPPTAIRDPADRR